MISRVDWEKKNLEKVKKLAEPIEKEIDNQLENKVNFVNVGCVVCCLDKNSDFYAIDFLLQKYVDKGKWVGATYDTTTGFFKLYKTKYDCLGIDFLNYSFYYLNDEVKNFIWGTHFKR